MMKRMMMNMNRMYHQQQQLQPPLPQCIISIIRQWVQNNVLLRLQLPIRRQYHLYHARQRLQRSSSTKQNDDRNNNNKDRCCHQTNTISTIICDRHDMNYDYYYYVQPYNCSATATTRSSSSQYHTLYNHHHQNHHNNTIQLRYMTSSSSTSQTTPLHHHYPRMTIQQARKQYLLSSVYDDNYDYHSHHDTTTTTTTVQPSSSVIDNTYNNNNNTTNTASNSSMMIQQQHWRNWYIPQEYENPWDMSLLFVFDSSNNNTDNHNNNTDPSSSSSYTSRFIMSSSSLSSSNNNYYDHHQHHPKQFNSYYSLQDYMKNLDYSSKHCIDLLQHYQSYTNNTITTELCNTILQQLLDHIPQHHQQRYNNNKTTKQDPPNTPDHTILLLQKSMAITYRAYAILQNMEYIDRTTIVLLYPNSNQNINNSNNKPYYQTIHLKDPTGMNRHHQHKYMDNSIIISSSSSTSSNSTTMNDDDDTNNDTMITSSPSNITSSIHHHHDPSDQSRRIPRILPKPNRETYNIMMLLLSRTMVSYDDSTYSYMIPYMAQQIVEIMEYRYYINHELEMNVTNYHWNSVILAWYNYYDAMISTTTTTTTTTSNISSIQTMGSNIIIYATQLLIYNALRSTTSNILVDGSSYIHILRMCTKQYPKQTNDVVPPPPNSSSSSYFGAYVAIQLWKEMFERTTTSQNSHTTSTTNNNNNIVHHPWVGGDPKEHEILKQVQSLLLQYPTSSSSSIQSQYKHTKVSSTTLYVPNDLPPHFYSHFLQAIRPLPQSFHNNNQQNNSTRYFFSNNNNNDNTIGRYNYTHPTHILSNKITCVRDLYYMKCFDHAKQHGKVNQYILQEFFIHVKNKHIFQYYFHNYQSQITKLSAQDAIQLLITELLPKEWSQHVTTSTHQQQQHLNNSASTTTATTAPTSTKLSSS